LVDMQEFHLSNRGYKYILTVIDIFSKFAWAIPLKNKNANSVTDAFKKIFQQRNPGKLQTDQGKEFVNQHLQKYLKELNIQFFTSKNPGTKCAVIERFNRTLKTKMFKYFTSKGTRKYFDVLPDLLNSYNHSFHRTIKMRPVDVSSNNEMVVFRNSFGYNNLTEYLNNKNTKQSNFKTGETVRKRYKLGPFDKAYYPLWTDKIYNIDQITSQQLKPYHKIRGENATEKDERRYYTEEIQKITPNMHRVEKVLRKRKRKNKIEFLVKWLNHPDSFNSWVLESDIQSL